jgi:hypothetical protein
VRSSVPASVRQALAGLAQRGVRAGGAAATSEAPHDAKERETHRKVGKP